jgi:hypothetical protein
LKLPPSLLLSCKPSKSARNTNLSSEKACHNMRTVTLTTSIRSAQGFEGRKKLWYQPITNERRPKLRLKKKDCLKTYICREIVATEGWEVAYDYLTRDWVKV